MYFPILRLGENVSGKGTATLDGEGGSRGKMKCGREVPAGVDVFLEADGGGAGRHGRLVGAATGIGVAGPGEAGVEVDGGCPRTILICIGIYVET